MFAYKSIGHVDGTPVGDTYLVCLLPGLDSHRETMDDVVAQVLDENPHMISAIDMAIATTVVPIGIAYDDLELSSLDLTMRHLFVDTQTNMVYQGNAVIYRPVLMDYLASVLRTNADLISSDVAMRLETSLTSCQDDTD